MPEPYRGEPGRAAPAEPLSAREARGGETVLRTRGERAVFIAGLAAAVAFALALCVAALWAMD